MSASSYFAQLENEQATLRRHGLTRWPSQSEAMEYTFETGDKVEALAFALGLELRKDYRGRWYAIRVRDAS